MGTVANVGETGVNTVCCPGTGPVATVVKGTTDGWFHDIFVFIVVLLMFNLFPFSATGSVFLVGSNRSPKFVNPGGGLEVLVNCVVVVVAGTPHGSNEEAGETGVDSSKSNCDDDGGAANDELYKTGGETGGDDGV